MKKDKKVKGKRNRLSITVFLLLISIIIIGSYSLKILIGKSSRHTDKYFVSSDEDSKNNEALFSGSFGESNYISDYSAESADNIDENTDENASDDTLDEADEQDNNIKYEDDESGIDTEETSDNTEISYKSANAVTKDNYKDVILDLINNNTDSDYITAECKSKLQSTPLIDENEIEVTSITLNGSNCSFDKKQVTVYVDTPMETLSKTFKFSLNYDNQISSISEQ
jgi:hypothetical protein